MHLLAEVLPTPEEVKQQLPLPSHLQQQVAKHRQELAKLLTSNNQPLLVVVGPCSLHCTEASLEYAQRLAALQTQVGSKLKLVMRAYIEKPRTSLGWKGLVNDPSLKGTADLAAGIIASRQLFLQLLATGLPLATEALNPALVPYFDDLISWYALGARTTESQTHREMASLLPAGVGFKNSTDGSFTAAINALTAASQAQQVTAINSAGRLANFTSPGNPLGHLVLRGGKNGPNYFAEDVNQASQGLAQAGLNPKVMIDASHANSFKQPLKQLEVLENIAEQLLAEQPILGVMLESFLTTGSQDINAKELAYGVSVTDACLGWQETQAALIKLANRLNLAAHNNRPKLACTA